MPSYFTDEFQLSDGTTYALGTGAVVNAPVLPPAEPNRWQPFVEKGTVTGNGTIFTPGGNVSGIAWPASFANPAISFKVTGSLAKIGTAIRIYLSEREPVGSTMGYFLQWEVNEAGKCVFSIWRQGPVEAEKLTGEAVFPWVVGDVMTAVNLEGEITGYRNGVRQNSIVDFKFGAGSVILLILNGLGTTGVSEIKVGDGSVGVIGRAQVVKYGEKINYTNFGIQPNAYQTPPCFLSNFAITPKVGTILSLEELRAEVTPVFVAGSLNGQVTQAEVQAFGNAINWITGPVYAVVMRDPFQYQFQGVTTPYEYRNGMYVPSFRGAGVIERLEIIPPRVISLQFSSHEAIIEFGLVEADPVVQTAVNKIFNPAVNIQGGKTLGFGIETVPGRLENAKAKPILETFFQFLEIRMAARYRIFELGERSS